MNLSIEQLTNSSGSETTRDSTTTISGEIIELDLIEAWNQSKLVLKSQLDPQIFLAWINPLKVSTDTTITTNNSGDLPTCEFELIAPNKFCCEHLRRNYEKIITSVLTEITGFSSLSLKFKIISPTLSEIQSTKSEPVITNANPNSSIPAAHPPILRIAKQPIPPSNKADRRKNQENPNLNPKYNFSNFVVGNCNQFSHAVSLQVCENPGTMYNPLFVYGGVGLGKTHLVNAIGNACWRRGKSVLLISSEVFVNELIAAIRSNNMPRFKSKFRSIDLLVIDDVQFIIGKERTQEEFFHTFNDLHHRHKQIIVTADKVPQELTGLEDRLRTRFASGVSVDLQIPDYETRVAILIKKAETSGITLEDSVARLLAERINTNVRELEGALNQLHALSNLYKSPISTNLAEEALRSFSPSKSKEVTTDIVQEFVAKYYNVSVNDLLGKRRTQNIAFARQVAMYLCRTLTGLSFPEIGAIFGGRDHSTAIYACRLIEDRLVDQENLRQELEHIKINIQ